jgi:hypothetical protein
MTVEEFNDTFKEGDILRIRQWILIFARIGGDNYHEGYHPIVYHALWDMDLPFWIEVMTSPGIGYVESGDNQQVRFATNQEKKEFYNALAVKGLAWDEDAKEFTKLAPVVTIDDMTGGVLNIV